MTSPKSCDTFVVLPPGTKYGVVFGKNSDRPQKEVQEVVYVKGGKRDEKLQCTYITIDESPNPVHSVILSKPAWMWGAEMGANDKNVVIGNEAVWTNHSKGDGDPSVHRLLGMDLVRLGLERADTADHALDIITSLLETYGQGGPCSEHNDGLVYHNSFIIADPKNAWVLETSGKFWVAEKVTQGYRNISNILTITTKIDRHSEGLLDNAKTLGLWDGKSEFNFSRCFCSGGDENRQKAGEILLQQATQNDDFDVLKMFEVLRNKESEICRSCDDSFPTQGSQVSYLSNDISCHWFTATPDPSLSFFKPFIFTKDGSFSPVTVSSDQANREHSLYKLHRISMLNSKNISKKLEILRKRERSGVAYVEELIDRSSSQVINDTDLEKFVKENIEDEIQLYCT